jgi:antitoxin ParD1/3/4
MAGMTNGAVQIMMTAMSKIDIELPRQLAEFLERQVEAGLFNSVADAIEDAVRRQYDADDVRIEMLRAAMAPGLADVETGRVHELTVEEILAEARATIRAAE